MSVLLSILSIGSDFFVDTKISICNRNWIALVEIPLMPVYCLVTYVDSFHLDHMNITKAIRCLIILVLIPAFMFGQRGRVEGDSPIATPAPPPASAFGVPHTFDIYVGGDKAGSYKATATQDGARTTYEATSETSVRFMGKITVSYSLKTVYENGILIKSDYISYKNGKLRDKTNIVWDGSRYTMDKKGDKSTIDEPIGLGVMRLYFQKPDVRKAFSESKGVFKNIIDKGQGKLVVTDLGETKGTEYVFEGDALVQVNLSVAMFDCTIVRK